MMALRNTLLSVLSIPLLHPSTNAFPTPSQPQLIAEKPIVALDYGTFQGAYSAEYNITHFRRIPFGASTAGQNRFRAPQPPSPINGVYNSDRDFDMCPQRTVNGSEDCLYLGLYSRPWNSNSNPNSKSLRPVVVFFYGGGFIRGSASFTLPPPLFPVLNASSLNSYIIIHPNYRTNVFGFLPSSAINSHPLTDLNPGLLDQQAVLRWVQKYIRQFGGDPKNVTIWGQSAGAGSVVAQVIAEGNRGRGLFTKAMASSPYWPKTYRYNDPEAEAIFKSTVDLAGCKGKRDEVQCLKDVDVQVLRDAADKIAGANTLTSNYNWAPVLGGNFLSESLTDVVKTGRLNAELAFGIYNLHEGENFIPAGLQNAKTSGGFNSSEASFAEYLTTFLPRFSAESLEEIGKLYPDKGTAEEISYDGSYERAGLVYRDLVLACPAYWIAKKAEKGWLADYTVSPAKHASDTVYWNQVNAVQKSNALTYQGFAGAMASFIQTADPNMHKVTDKSVVGVPSISDNQQFVVAAGGFRNGGIEVLQKRCVFWETQGKNVPI
ncbi:alpha/beta-hydrolase [Delitschia confertaspora ATCC 74209]|uniref:Carboxylic ester hydrolase n=1 Tax=Delitschia confertaspora ATCC 74209 TaxID=1513339 RepID=A0A9P4MTB8_9PLEO|nr:alpha/beta-hydrolase [Delitschia confertaspora ATCC 74209]